MTNDVDDDAQQLQANQTEQQQCQAQDEGQQAIAAKLPGQGEQTAHELARGIAVFGRFRCWRFRHPLGSIVELIKLDKLNEKGRREEKTARERRRRKLECWNSGMLETCAQSWAQAPLGAPCL